MIMKRRIGTYKNKILVENAGNELRNYEIAIEQLGNNNTGGISIIRMALL